VYRVIEVSRMLGVSKVTVYKKLEQLKKELKPYLKHRSNIIYIDDLGVSLIKDSLNLIKSDDSNSLFSMNSTRNCKVEYGTNEISDIQTDNSTHDDTSVVSEYRDMLQRQLDLLDHQIRLRTDELVQKEEQLKLLQRIVKWNKSSFTFLDGMHSVLEKTLE